MRTPKEIVVLSGKGGTGKTSLTAAFAMFARSPIAADCDVDASNLHMLLSPVDRVRGDFAGGREAVIRPDACLSCGKCLELCRFEAVSVVDGHFQVDHCEGCGVCVEFCPEGAIDWVATVAGGWMVGDGASGPLVHARLKPGAENSGKLVAKVRDLARQEARTHQSTTILLDGPPGIGCPAIASLSGAHAAVVVTEPTVSGIHDMLRILDLCAHFGVAAGIVVNKADLDMEATRSIGEIAKCRGLPLLGELPYDRVFTEAQRAGLALPLHRPEHATVARLRHIWAGIDAWSEAYR